MCGILVGKCHFVRVYWCYEVGYVKRYGLCCWYGMREKNGDFSYHGGIK